MANQMQMEIDELSLFRSFFNGNNDDVFREVLEKNNLYVPILRDSKHKIIKKNYNKSRLENREAKRYVKLTSPQKRLQLRSEYDDSTIRNIVTNKFSNDLICQSNKLLSLQKPRPLPLPQSYNDVLMQAIMDDQLGESEILLYESIKQQIEQDQAQEELQIQ